MLRKILLSRRSEIQPVGKRNGTKSILSFPRSEDNFAQECPEVDPNTNYDGFCYFGEYPLSFAAVLQQEESARLLVAKGADTNCQDSNGNTALHMCVIYNRIVRLSHPCRSLQPTHGSLSVVPRAWSIFSTNWEDRWRSRIDRD